MQDLAAYCEARERLQLAVDQRDATLTLSVMSSLDASKYGTPELTLLIPAASKVKSVSLELTTGEKKPVEVRSASDDSTRVVVTLPATAKTLQVTFCHPIHRDKRSCVEERLATTD